MGVWSFYFFLKLFLYLGKFIGFHVWPNLGFALALAWPLERRWQRVLRQVLAVPAGLALLYYDSWLPPFQRLISQAGYLQQFSFAYLLELLGRFVNPLALLGLVLLFAAWWLLGQRLRMGSFAVLGILLVPLSQQLGQQLSLRLAQPATALTAAAPATSAGGDAATVATAVTDTRPADSAELNSALEDFYRREAGRQLKLNAPASPAVPFDVIFLHICSLAWDDMDYVGESKPAVLDRFDIRFSNYSTAASYSGPAAIRLLRSACGQTSHSALYKPAPGECYLFNTLAQAGYQSQLLMNHDGHFGDFVGDLREGGGLKVPAIDNRSAPVKMRAFDDSPVYGDLALLSGWLAQRPAEGPPVALYYNTVSLHDGNKLVGVPKSGVRDSFRQRLQLLFSDLGQFLDQLQASGRKAVVVLVPEHGAAVRGDRMQISGLREIPSPAIALAPVAVKLIGLAAPPKDGPVTVSAPTSLFGLSSLVARFIEHSPYGSEPPALADYLRELPQTEFVAENDATVVMRLRGRYYLRNPDQSWAEYDTSH
ncbi:MAG: cellulose biosynthesis protein BcsG [Nevskiaceae bacterium]|nr:MAG: cellulose biosynthesis protein BcsG [Nevskiaceae bacterium]TAM28960.1 MAG: cellulose biosynthesis protein BcsG [Nevskiaceae bacterium]